MRLFLVFLSIFFIFNLSGCTTYEKVMDSTIRKYHVTDDRIKLKLPPQMKLAQKEMMRTQMDLLARIAEAFSEDNLKEVERISRERLGWSSIEEKKWSSVAELCGESDFFEFAMVVHRHADELASNARAGDVSKALKSFAGLIENCNACHKRFRH
ncbi:MAG: cytochrome c [Deltaproteobacteria bacterium]|nr:cytochrome c [Deltaproteobacteria bacterium]